MGKYLLITVLLFICLAAIADLNKDLFDAVRENDYTKVKNLIQKGADVNSRDHHGWQPINWCDDSRLSIVKLLIDNGASLNAQNHQGWTPVNWAAHKRRYKMVRLLTLKGADVNIKNKDGWNPLLIVSRDNNMEEARFLVENGADVNVKNTEGWTALHYFYFHKRLVTGTDAESEYLEMIDFLIENGADKNTRNNKNQTPAEVAEGEGASVSIEEMAGIDITSVEPVEDYFTNDNLYLKDVITIEPIPVSIDLEKLIIKGIKLPNTNDLYCYHEFPDGLVTTETISWNKDNFKIVINFKKRGVHTLEFVAIHKTRGGAVPALIHIQVDTDEKKSIKKFPDYPAGSVKDAEKQHLKAINDLRGSLNITLMQCDDELAEICRKHAEIWVEHAVIAHTTAWDGSPWDRVKAAKYSRSVTGEIIGGGKNAGESMFRLYNSTAHRFLMLDKNSTYCGVGAAKTQKGLYVFGIMFAK